MKSAKFTGMQFDLLRKDAVGVHSGVLGSREWVKKEKLVLFAQSNQQEWIYSARQQTLLQYLKEVWENLFAESEMKIDKEL